MPAFRFRALFLALVACLAASPALAFVRTMSSTGRPLYWANSSVSFQAHPGNASGLSAAQVSSLFSGAFSSWNLTGSNATLSYSQSTSYPASSGNDGANAVYFASQGGRNMEWGVIAITEVLYWVSSGQIAGADLVFNDQQFRFTANAGDTGQNIGGRTAIYLPDVATHEVGHALGLDHSLVNLSSMIYTAFSGQFTLGQDDVNGVRSLYPSGARTGGSLSGTVSGTQGGIFGAHVTAVSLADGRVEAGALSGSDGRFTLGDVPPGKYAVMMEPFGADITSVSPYFQNVNHRFCSGARFRRRFYSACGAQGIASVVEVRAGADTALGTLAPSCSYMGNPGGPPNSVAFARELPTTGGAAWGTMRASEAHYYLVRGVAGQLSARAMSFSLYSPVDVKVEILDHLEGAVPGATSVDNIQDPMPGGKTHYDSLATANVAAGDYLIKVTTAASRIPSSHFSAGWELMDNEGHYLLSLGVNGSYGNPAATDMSACLSVRNTAQNASYRDSPPIRKEEEERAAGCASIGSGGNPFSGGMMQVLLTALAIQLAAAALRLRPSLVPNRR